MIKGELNIWEVDVDGPPDEPGSYLFWLDGEGFMLYDIEDEDLDDFDDNFDGIKWSLNGKDVVAYTNQEYMELGYL